jgi:hypothetical protein
MTAPHKFRPTDVEADPDHDGEVTDWSDNSVSNTFAWLSVKIVPTWCQDPSHWTAPFTDFFWTDCPCCLLWRGITLGWIAMFAIYTALLAFFSWIS